MAGMRMGEGWKSRAARSCALVGALAALYVIPACTAKPPADLKSLAAGDMKSLSVEAQPAPAPQIPFADASGKSHTLADYKGRVVVLNLWATWCGPCVAEMPTLAKLQSAEAGKAVAILPVSVDREEDKANAEDFIAKRAPLGFYTEPTYALARAFTPAVEGLPTTVLIDPAGRVRARLSGGADWSGPDARKVIDALAAGA
jgi:thiol-disulfide isomerase/thioredoxin